MPFRPISPPRPGSIDRAAQRIYEILDRAERARQEARGHRVSRSHSLRPAASPEVRDESTQRFEPVAEVRVAGDVDRQRDEQIAARRRSQPRRLGSTQHTNRDGNAVADVERDPVSPLPAYGWGDAIIDKLRGVKDDDYEDYVAVNAAQSEMVGSQLPGREDGPADAYRHILWAAELTRRFGEKRARELLGLHELEGLADRQAPDAAAMDRSNNEIGVALGAGARKWGDVVSAARRVLSGSARDGSGMWQQGIRTDDTLAPVAARWLAEERWTKNPTFEARAPVGIHPPHARIRDPRAGQEMAATMTNWYTNPARPNGPAWIGGYVPDRYRYLYGDPQHVTGPEDERMRRAVAAYRFAVTDPVAKFIRSR